MFIVVSHPVIDAQQLARVEWMQLLGISRFPCLQAVSNYLKYAVSCSLPCWPFPVFQALWTLPCLLQAQVLAVLLCPQEYVLNILPTQHVSHCAVDSCSWVFVHHWSTVRKQDLLLPLNLQSLITLPSTQQVLNKCLWNA